MEWMDAFHAAERNHNRRESNRLVVLLLHLAVGALILLWWFVWSLVHNTKGSLALNRNEAIANPELWMSGDYTTSPKRFNAAWFFHSIA